MIALEIKITKNIMNALLLSEQFDSFLVEEAIITTYNTFHIDGHLVKDFYTNEELELLESEEKSTTFSCWQDIRPFCLQLIKGKKTPVSFKVILHAAPLLIEKIAANPECGVAANLIRSLVLNIRYDNGKVTCITGSAFTTFVMDKSVDKLWDAYMRQLLSDFGLDFEEI
ncbi:MAG: DUF5721 family protein [Lachnospiraceae bacterium]|jgi:hypothetical protein|nr:DUF5721 family protein [Lachnospiraceae bacterium]HBV82158.1 hypothetical protein [Lachnospiraceae bacterium]